jgi:heterodisulfide reductase subunit A2
MSAKRIGVYLCWCGSNIAKMVDVEKVAQVMDKISSVKVSRDYKYMCSDPGQELIMKDIKEHQLDRIVVSSCSPRMHEPTFRKALSLAGLNPYMLQMANIREHVSWVHEDRELATAKAINLTRAAVFRVMAHEPLKQHEVPVIPSTLVLGGGITGMTAALRIAGHGSNVYLVERASKLGGRARKTGLSGPHLTSVTELLATLKARIEATKEIEVLTRTNVAEVSGFVGNFHVRMTEGSRELTVGNIVVATGTQSFDPRKLPRTGYGKVPNVVTSTEFEGMMAKGQYNTDNGKTPRSIAIIHCVGSRDKGTHSYCSRTCCMEALKFSSVLRDALPDAAIYQAYSDMRAFGRDAEEFYAKTAEKGVTFLLFDKLLPPTVVGAPIGDTHPLLMNMEEIATGESIEVPVDLVILMVAAEARDDSKDVAKLVSISVDKDGFFIEKHPKLDPAATTTDGIFIAGNCQGPKDIPDCMAQAGATAARILSCIAKGKVQISATTATVNEELCVGCQTCINVCPYGAVIFLDEHRVSKVEEVVCKGCGTCAAACPAGAISPRHFTDKQVLSQLEGLLAAEEG